MMDDPASLDPTLLIAALAVVSVLLVLAVAGLVIVRRNAAETAERLQEAREDEQEAAEAALSAERTAHEATRASLQETRENLREATVRAGEVPRLEEKLAKLEARAFQAEKDLEGMTRQSAERDRAHREQVQTLVAFREDMEKQFKALSNEALNAQSDTFAKSSKERLETMLGPLREQIGKFESAFVQDGQTRAAQSSSLKTMIESLARETGKAQETAENLAKALKSGSQARGAWGEMILQTILEKSGLREGEEFHREKSHTLDDGGRLRPDVVVNLPGGQKLVIDSKVNLIAFDRCVNCDDDEERTVHAKGHVASMRTHIKDLSGKDYSALYGGVDFVIMFVPIEGALSLAIQTDPDMTGHAAASNVMIASPNTLLMALRTVQNLWRIERQNQNAEDIANRAGLLYEKFVGFVEDLERVGETIMRAHGQYEKARTKLSSGTGNLVRQTEMLKKLGARTAKQLPDRLVELSQGGEAFEEDAPRELTMNEKNTASNRAPRNQDEQGAGAAGEDTPRSGNATHPETLPLLNAEKADDYDDLSREEKEVAAAISQDWDA